MKILFRAGVVVAAAGALVLTPAIAQASPKHTAPSLARSQASVTKQLDVRLGTLQQLTAAVNHSSTVLAAHKATLLSLYATDTAGLTDLKAKVAGDTTVAQVKADATTMVHTYRVYLVVVPMTILTLRADGTAAAADKLAVKVKEAQTKANGTRAVRLAKAAADLTKAADSSQAAATSALAVTPAQIAKGVSPFKAATKSLHQAQVLLSHARALLWSTHWAHHGTHVVGLPGAASWPKLPQSEPSGV
jgi:predicted RND superfamily exporter protein